MPDGNEILVHLSGATSAGGAQADPNASLGRFYSSSFLHELEGSVTSGGIGGGRTFADSARIGDGVDAHVGKWILFLTGADAVDYATRVEAFDNSTGEFILRDVIPNGLSAGDDYRLFVVGNLFDQATALEAALGHVDHRMVALRNIDTNSAANVRVYLEEVDPGPVAFDLVIDNAAGSHLDYNALTDDEDDPDLSQFYTAARFTRPESRDTPPGQAPAPFVPASGITALPANGTGSAGLWLRRTVRSASRGFESVWKLVVDSTTTGGDPDPLRSGALIVSSVAGLTEALAVNLDRFPRLLGGARVRGVLTAQETGLPLEDETVTFSITAGPGTLAQSEADTDSDGLARVVYISPTDPADVGQTVTIQGEA